MGGTSSPSLKKSGPPRTTHSDTTTMRRNSRAATADNNNCDENDDDDDNNNCATPPSPWDTSTSRAPMLTCLHANHHLHQHQHHYSPRSQANNGSRRSFSFDDHVDFEHLIAPMIMSKEDTKLVSTNDTNNLFKQQQRLSTPPSSPFIRSSFTAGQKLPQESDDKEQQQQQQQLLQQIRIPQNNFQKETTPVGISILYGMINATIVLPVLMSFGSIIYRDAAFQPYLNVLIKMTVISGVVHQLCFSTLSKLPFAVGQVQDAGLIFLSSMAGTLVTACRDRDADDETLLATATVGLSLCTALLGLSLVWIGKLRLASWVQKLPTSVVGGYLAFIGFFCGISGVGLMAGVSKVTWDVVCANLQFILPGIFGGIFIYSLVRYLRHMAVLPTCIVFLFATFYFILWMGGISVEEATNQGWIANTKPPPVWYHSWDYLKLDKVLWSALPQLLLTEISMIFVVALSSSLDIAAIELELKEPLDYDSELKMIGISNFVSGITGGYTGSYIFSQSIFSLRAGIRSPLAGYVLAGCEILFLIAPFSILAYVPNFFFGSLLSLICVDLVFEWLIESRNKLTSVEYIICLSTFALILVTGVEYGIVLGVLLYIGCKRMGLDLGDNSVEESDDEFFVENTGDIKPLTSSDTNGVGYGTLSDT